MPRIAVSPSSMASRVNAPVKASTRRALIVSCATIRRILIGGIALSDIRSTMMAEREAGMATLLKAWTVTV